MLATPSFRGADGKETKLTPRIEPYRATKTDPPLPPLTARHVYDWLMEAGPVESTPMGKAPISWREIDAWAARTFQSPTAWETRMLRRLSAEYLSELHAAEDCNRLAPWSREPTRTDRENEEQRLRSVLG